MKRLLTTVLVLVMIAGLQAAVQYENYSDHIDIELSNLSEMAVESGVYYTNLAFPAREVRVEVIESEVNLIDQSGEPVSTGEELDEDRVIVEESMVMRDLFMHRLRIEVERTERGVVSQIENLVIRLEAESEIEMINSVSSVFAPIYGNMVDNYQTSYLRNLQEMPAKMLIVSHTGLNNLEYFTDWKNERGIATEVVYKSDLGDTVVDIKNYIQAQYDTEEHPPDYLLLIGDVNGAYTLPSYYHSSENDVTDHPYTLLDGNDYLPEMIVGRFSIDQNDDLNTIIAKVLHYEKTPYLDDPNWYERMVVVAGNYSDTPPPPSTPVTTSMWLAEKALDYGYQEVTEIYYWPPEYPTYPGTTEITNAIDAGAGIVTYRGWGNAWGWNFPYFHTENIDNLSNGMLLPVMTSVVCNTGDFANVNVDPCFGEKWLTAGSNSNPKGGVVFLGPSDLHTSTRYNNSIFAGFYQGLLCEGIHSFGVATLRGKTELYNNFPLNLAAEGNVEFYYYVYNILGDPSLSIWTKTPEELTCQLPASLDLGENYIDVYVPEIASGMVTARKEGEFLVSEYVRNHHATLFFDAETAGTMHVTVTAVNHLPFFTDMEIVSSAIDPSITAIEPQSEVAAGATLNVNLTLTNQGTQTATFNGEIDELTGMAEITNSGVSFGSLAAGASATVPIEIMIDAECLNNWELSFELDFSDLGKTVKFPLLVANMILEPISIVVNDANGVLEPGETSNVTVSLVNIGSSAGSGVSAVISSPSTAITVNSGTADLGTIPVGGSADGTFNLTANSGGFNGRNVNLVMQFEDSSGKISESICTLTVGVVTNTDPTGPCAGGYYAYDSFDTDYEEAPVYFWQEIDPIQGGSGEAIYMEDDQSETIDLPFTFKYYDIEYDSITISSNGWISFVTTWQTFFRNWMIPGALGPYAQVAAYWDDLIGPGGGAEDSRVCYYYDSANDYFIIEWANTVNRQDNVSPEIFQIVLYNPSAPMYATDSGNGVIQVNYSQVSNPDNNDNYCTVGIEDELQEIGVQYTYANLYPASATELQNGLAIKFTTNPPDDYTAYDNDNVIAGVPILRANYPNPFNPVTTISFSLSESAQTELIIYNIKGEKIKTLANKYLDSGEHSYLWNGDDDKGNAVASGIYFYKLKSNRHTTTKKCVLMK